MGYSLAALFRSSRRATTPLALCLTLSLALGCGGLASTDADLFPEPAEDTVTFWGHACVYIDVDGVGVVTDPVFSKRMLVRWRKIPAPPPGSYARTSVILISHPHDDHLNTKTIATFPESAVVLCPEPSQKYLRDVSQRVVSMKPGDVHEFSGGRIIAVDAHHPGGRRSLNAEADGRALGYVIETPRVTIYYSGDSDPFPGFKQVGDTYHPDFAILNINGHLHGRDAALAAFATQARTILPTHWGAYGYLFFGRARLPRDEHDLERILGDRLVKLEPGESISLKKSPSPP